MKFLLLAVTVLLCALYSSAQFFTKGTTHSIPRMGRRSDLEESLGSQSVGKSSLPNIVRKVARSLKLAFELIERYDEDGNGALDAEELMDLPMIEDAVRQLDQRKEVESPYVTEESSQGDASSKDTYNRQLIITEESTQGDKTLKDAYNRHLMM